MNKNPFMPLADLDDEESLPEEIATTSEEEHVQNDESKSQQARQKQRAARKRRNRKNRSSISRLKQQLLEMISFPTRFALGIIKRVWVSFLDTICDRQRTIALENTIKTLASKIDALEKAQNDLKAEMVRRPALSVSEQRPSVPQEAPVQPATEAPSIALTGMSVDPVVEKYKKMLSVGVPEPAVRQKMMKDGVDPRLLFKPEIAEKKVEFKRTVRTDVVAKPTCTPARVNITVAALEEIRGSLRKSGLRPRISDENSVQQPRSNMKPTPYAISVSALEEIRGSLRKTPRRKDNGRTPELGIPRSPMCDVTNFRDRFANSPRRTPFDRRIAQNSPSTARSDGEFLQLALLRKFQNVASPCEY